MMNYEIEEREFGSTWVKVIGENVKKETMTIEIVHCTNSGGKKSLPYLWYKNGWTSKVLETYICCHTYVHDSEGCCRGLYNPTVKLSDDKKRNVINFDWTFEDTKENMIKIIEECVRLFESATGKSATEKKIDNIMKAAKEMSLEVTTELPAGYEEHPHASDPIGAVSITNGESFFKRVNGKAKINPNYKRMLMII